MKLLRPLCTLLFGMAVLLFFGLAYPHHLHYQEQFQLFLFDSSYVWEIVKLPGGVADLLGRFCTQFLLFAWVGALIIAILLSAVQLLILRLCNSLTVAPSTEQKNNVQRSTFNVQCIYGLSFVPSFLLWLFLLDENALLGGVWAVLLTLLVFWAFDKIPDGWLRRVLLIIAVPVLYWIAGPVSVLFFLLQALRYRSVWSLAALALMVAMPFVLSNHIPVLSSKLWFGVHYHRYPAETPTLLWAAVLSIVLLAFLVRAFKVKTSDNKSSSRVSLLGRGYGGIFSFALVAVIMGFLVMKNSNFKAEKVMQYDFMACHQQWNRILETINADKPNNQIGVTVQNLALAMNGMLGDHMFEYHQNGTAGLLPDVQSDATSPLPTAEAFYQLGMVNFAQRAVFEAQEAILDFQKSARCYKRLAQTNLVNGKYEVARKYLMALHKTLFYSDWAEETLPLLGNEEAIAKHPEYGRLRQSAYHEDFFFADQVTPMMLQTLFSNNEGNRLAYEYLMADYLLTGDLESFANTVGWGEKLGYQAIPRHFQEALILWWSMNHGKTEQQPPQLSPAVVQRFSQLRSFLQSPSMTPEGLAQSFGDTYWYYFFTQLSQAPVDR